MRAARATLLMLMLAGVSFAQSRTTLVDAPLAVLMPMPEEEAKALQSDFRQALARLDAVLLPTRSSWNRVVTAVGRGDCGVHDACLQQLAQASGALYALFASVERNAAGTELTVTGRVVDRDGRPVRAQVRLTRAAAGYAAVQAALEQLVLELELDALPVVLAPKTLETLPTPPPLVVPELSDPPARVAGWVTLGVAISAAATSVAFGVEAANQLHGLPPDGRPTSEDQVRRQVEGNRSVSIAVGTGLGAGVLLVTSLGLLLASRPITVTASPTSEGAAVLVSGRF